MAEQQSLIEAYVAATAGVNSPERLRRWAGVCLVAGALARRVWTEVIPGRPIYPNLFVLLAGPPGTGKNEAILPARELLLAASNERVSPNVITAQKLISWLATTTPVGVDADGEVSVTCSVAAFVAEWANLMKEQNSDMMGALADLYDCPHTFEASTISRGEDKLENVCINILAGVTPAWFANGFPPNAFEQGLPARLHLIYADPMGRPPALFGDAQKLDTLHLEPAVRCLANHFGLVEWEPAAQVAFRKWVDSGMPPVVDDPMLGTYNNRRLVHTAKLAMIHAFARAPGKLGTKITLPDLEAAWALMFEAEREMPRALVAAGGNIYKLREDAIVNFVYARYVHQKGKAVPEWEVRQRLARMVPAQLLSTIIDELLHQRVLEVTNPDARSPNRLLRPGEELMKERRKLT